MESGPRRGSGRSSVAPPGNTSWSGSGRRGRRAGWGSSTPAGTGVSDRYPYSTRPLRQTQHLFVISGKYVRPTRKRGTSGAATGTNLPRAAALGCSTMARAEEAGVQSTRDPFLEFQYAGQRVVGLARMPIYTSHLAGVAAHDHRHVPATPPHGGLIDQQHPATVHRLRDAGWRPARRLLGRIPLWRTSVKLIWR